MQGIILRLKWLMPVVLGVLGTVSTLPAQAAGYRFTSIDYPGVSYTTGGFVNAFGINNLGKVVGNVGVSGNAPNIPIVYDYKRNIFTVLPNYSNLATQSFGINDFGAVAGNVVTDASQDYEGKSFILYKGAFTTFSNANWPHFIQARAINAWGIVTGYAYNDTAGTYSGFIYNPYNHAFVDFLRSANGGSTIAQGINFFGEVVGSTYLRTVPECPTCLQGTYSFLRNSRGDFTFFRVNGGTTRARGINDFGQITGFYVDVNTGTTRGFVTRLQKNGPAFQELTVGGSGLLDLPGSQATIPEGISDDGVVAGIYDAGDGSGNSHAFVATPNR
jgi:uncharacterized membrane protein